MIRFVTAAIVILSTAGIALAETREEKAQRYIKQLDAKDAKSRASAAEELGRLCELKSAYGKPALKTLIKLFDDKDTSVRAAAAGCACRINEPKEVVPAVIKLLKDEKEDRVKIAAVTGLAIIGEPAREALPLIRDMAQDARSKKNNRLAQACRTATESIGNRGMKKK